MFLLVEDSKAPKTASIGYYIKSYEWYQGLIGKAAEDQMLKFSISS